MTRIILCLVLAVSRLVSQEGTVFDSSLKEGLLCIARNDIQASMNYLRRGINCFWLEKGLGTGDLEGKINSLIAGENSHSKRAAYLVYAAVVEMANGPVRYDRAFVLLNDAQLEDPALPEVYNTRGVVLYSQRKWDAALTDYSKAIELNPRYVDAIRNRSDVYRQLGKLDLAVADFARFQDLLNSLYYQQ